MKQSLAMLFVTVLLLFSLAGCGEKKDNSTANTPPSGTTDNGTTDSGKKDDTMPGDDMSGENTKDNSVTGDGMMGDDMNGNESAAGRSTGRRNAAASASDRSRYFGSDKTITHENGNLYGKTYLNPETDKSANAQLRSNGRSMTGIPAPARSSWPATLCARPTSAVKSRSYRKSRPKGRLFFCAVPLRCKISCNFRALFAGICYTVRARLIPSAAVRRER